MPSMGVRFCSIRRARYPAGSRATLALSSHSGMKLEQPEIGGALGWRLTKLPCSHDVMVVVAAYVMC